MNELEPAYKNEVSKVQQVVALLESINQHVNVNMQQPVAHLHGEAFLSSAVSRVKAIPDELKSSLPQIEELEQELKSN